MDAIEDRLLRLERRSRRLQVGIWAAVAILVASYAVIPSQGNVNSEVLKARHFLVTDEYGNVRASLGVKTGVVGLALYDRKERLRLEVNVQRSTEEEQARILLYDPDINVRTILGSYEATPTNDSDVVVERPEASIVFFSKERRVVWRAPAQPWLDE
jgi:hypothetical protein